MTPAKTKSGSCVLVSIECPRVAFGGDELVILGTAELEHSRATGVEFPQSSA